MNEKNGFDRFGKQKFFFGKKAIPILFVMSLSQQINQKKKN